MLFRAPSIIIALHPLIFVAMVGVLNLHLLSAFIPTFFLVSVTPGMCMTLSMSLGISIGVRRTRWMMLGELIGVGIVATSAVIGAATLMLNYPLAFTVLKWAGGTYLIWLGLQMWLSKGRLALADKGPDEADATSRIQLISQGFVTAIANPKGWAFFIVLLPPFIDPGLPMTPQLSILIALILSLELSCLLLYAHGGQSLNRLLRRHGNVRLLNRISGTLLLGVGIWLALS